MPAEEISLKWVYFDYDNAALTPETIAILEETARVLKENPNISIELEGHTDGKGTGAYNIRLSQRRVQSVHQYLTSEGISESRLRTAAFGKAKPVADDKTEEGRARNRRVEIRIIR
jgi:OmpA-OmpF porin, OOP family